ncbi:hypothetical protein [Gloeobacter kilaueensis]|uniref:hypothetical protein n=1 Tax=Gloeobacter kilaueensis TaxID=1416614 RepID=UPI00059CA771|nr:hypothetical protein [Gloeobacter kilaueensis]
MSHLGTFLDPALVQEILFEITESGAEVVLVGGQAVNFWSILFARETANWQELQPYTSMDIDFLGTRQDAELIGRALGAKITLNKNIDGGTPNTGVLLVQRKNTTLLIDVLGSVYGVSTEKILEQALAFIGRNESAGVKLKVIDPITLLEGKLANLKGLPQHDRQDEKHIRLLLLVIPEFVASLDLKGREFIEVIKALFALAESKEGLCVWYQYSISVEEAVPWSYLQAETSEVTSRFRERTVNDKLQRLEAKRQKYKRTREQAESRGSALKQKRHL